MRAGLFEGPRPAEVALFVEARHQLDDDRHLLAAVGGAHERRHHRRVGPGPVERLLDREHVRVVGGLFHEGEDGLEPLVRVVHEEVARVEHVEDAVGLARSPSTGTGLIPGSRRAVEPRQFHDAPERMQIEESGHAVQVLVIEAGEAREQRRQDAARAAVDFEAHDVALPAAPQLHLEGFDIRLPAFIVQLQLGVARKAEGRRLEDDLPGEQRVEALANHVVEQRRR